MEVGITSALGVAGPRARVEAKFQSPREGKAASGQSGDAGESDGGRGPGSN
jgi:hypothetical protein